MNGSSFLDTNIIVYCYTSTEPEKGKKAKALVENTSVISLQVIHEFANVLQKKFGKSEYEILKAIEELILTFTVYPNNAGTVKIALAISGRYQYSFFDALIIAAALEADCEKLYSEDLHHGQIIDRRA